MTLYQRYLMFISYLGGGFRGNQFQPNQVTVQGVLEEALRTILTRRCFLSDEEQNNLKVIFSSRTDSGVHATRAGGHINVPLKDGRFVKPYTLQFLLNHFLTKNNISVRISDCLLVPDTFHSKRSVLHKTYYYRLGIHKKTSEPTNLSLPITELNNTHFVLPSNDFDYDVAKEVASLFVGEKDFAAFCGKPTKNLIRGSVCNIISSDFEETQPLLPDIDFQSRNFTYYAYKCKGNRFVYRMVRRMVSTILAAGTKRITLDTVRLMIEKPEPSSWVNRIKLFPGKGLHLIDTVYDPEHFLFSEEEVAKKLPYWSQTIKDPDELHRLVRIKSDETGEGEVKCSTEL